MHIPAGAKTHELPGSTIWLDENGILFSISNKTAPQNVEEAKEAMAMLQRYVGEGRKVCMLIDVTNTSETTREMRNFAAEQLPEIAKAIAIVSQSALGKMLANLFFSLKSQPYPVKYFNDETEAQKWLTQYV